MITLLKMKLLLRRVLIQEFQLMLVIIISLRVQWSLKNILNNDLKVGRLTSSTNRMTIVAFHLKLVSKTETQRIKLEGRNDENIL